LGEEVRVERQRADGETALASGLSVSLDFGFHHGDGFGARKAWLTREAPVGAEEAYVVDDGTVALFDAAVIAIGGDEVERAAVPGPITGAEGRFAVADRR
jgi:hypothetical protein